MIGTIVGDPTIVVRDIQDPANAHNLCSFDTTAQAPQFVSGSVVAYETAANQIVRADLAAGTTSVAATFSKSDISTGQYAFSPDGRSVTFFDGDAWHLVGPSGNRVLATLPPVPGRGIAPDDDFFLRYSPDGKYIALFQTLHTGGTGQTAPDQIRRADDGSLIYSTSGMSMAAWASVPARLFFRDSTGSVHRWDSTSGLSSMLSLRWLQPRPSPDGRWIAYTTRNVSGLGSVGLYSVQSNTANTVTQTGRSGVRFVSNDLVFYAGERACSNCLAPEPSGQTYIYDIAGATEVTARLASVLDAWPHSTAPGL